MVRGSKSSRKKKKSTTAPTVKKVVVPSFVRKSVGCKYKDVEYSHDDKRVLCLAGNQVRVLDSETGRI